MRNILVFLLGLVTGLWLYERQERQRLVDKTSRKSRTMEELSPTYKSFIQDWREVGILKTPKEHRRNIKKIIQEVDFRDLSEMEIAVVKKQISELVGLMAVDADDLINPNTLPPSYED
jgi:uncharacterized membrane protein